MTCCVVALALAMQLIETWRRVKTWCGIAPRTSAADYGLGTVIAGLLERLRLPSVRHTVLMLMVLEAVVAGAWAYTHRAHIGNEVAALLFATTGFGRGLCDGDVITASSPR